MARVFVCGVAVLDLVLSVEVLPDAAAKYRARDAVIVGGGCAANAAAAIARLGGEAWLGARLGADPVGDLILAGLREEGVDTTLVQRAAGAQSSFSSVLVDAAGERQIVNFRGAGLPGGTAWLDEAPAVGAVLADTRWTEGAEAAMRLARERGVPGILDAEAPMSLDLLTGASHVAFSAQGLRSFVEDRDLPDALAEAASRLGVWACVTDGANGAWMTAGAGIERVPAFAVTVRDTLGAGDVWHGAFALRLAEGATEAEAVVFANAAAGLKCATFGGRRGCPDRLATERLIAAGAE